MPTRSEVLDDRAIGGTEPLGMARGLKARHASLPLAGRLMRVHRAAR